jgi:hypothetical protein
MATITTLVNSAGHAERIREVIDDTCAFLDAPNKQAYLEAKGVTITPEMKQMLDLYYWIDIWCPQTSEESFDLLAMRIIRNMSIASITASDQPIPLTGSGSLETAISNLFKIAIAISFNEAQQIEFAKLLERREVPESAILQIYQQVEDLPIKVVRTLIMLMYQGLTTGRVFFLDPRTGLTARLDFNYLQELFPPALTGVRAWTEATTATGIADLQELQNAFYRRNGFTPQQVGAHSFTWQALCRQQSTKDEAIGLGIVQANPTGIIQVSFNKLQMIFEERRLPQPVCIDAQVELEIRPTIMRRINVVSEGRIFFASPKIGERVFGKTIESGKGLTDGYKSGIWVDLDPKDAKKNEDRVEAVGRGITHINDAKHLCGRQVYAA